MIVLRDDSARVTRLVAYVGVADGERHVQREFAGDVAGQRALVHDRCKERVIARVDRGCRRRGGSARRTDEWGGRSASRGTGGNDVVQSCEEGVVRLDES